MWLSTITAALVVVVGASAAVGSHDLGYWTDLGPGPGFFPMWLGVLLCVCGATWLAQTVRRQRRSTTVSDESPAPEATEVVATGEEAPQYSLPTVIAIVVSLCVLAGMLEILGYQLSMLLFLLFHLLVLGRRRLLLSAVLSVVGSFGVFVVFTRLLSVPLPASSVPFLRDLGL